MPTLFLTSIQRAPDRSKSRREGLGRAVTHSFGSQTVSQAMTCKKLVEGTQRGSSATVRSTAAAPCGSDIPRRERSWRLPMRRLILATTVIVSFTSTALAQDHKAQAMAADALKWGPAPPVLPKGGQMAVLAG